VNIRIAQIQVGWDITVSRLDFEELRLDTNAGVISVLPVGEDHVKLSTFDQAQFDTWCAILLTFS
jgi:hypothetical protein